MGTANKKRVILIVIDGFGVSLTEQGNAISSARTPTFDFLEEHFPFGVLKASGISVGLSWHEAGNSEVGHMTMGIGRITYQYLPRIINAIRDGSFFTNPQFVRAVDHVKKNNSTLHLVGLLGTGAVHSYIDHLYALLDLARKKEISDKVVLHIFTDGKDSLPDDGAKLVSALQERLTETKTGIIASITGRFYAMDRDFNWDRTEAAYRALVEGKGEQLDNPVKYLETSYAKGFEDHSIKPGVVYGKDNKPVALIKDGDSVIFFNYREDRERQLGKAIALPDLVPFKTTKFKNLCFVSMTQYEDVFKDIAAFPPPVIANCLSEVLSANGVAQLHLAETEKYAHVTYFFNGTIEKPFTGEDRILVPSPEAVSYHEVPEMSTPEIANKLFHALEEGKYQFLLVNLANCDMVGHTGDFEATIKAVESVDEAIKKILDVVLADEYTTLIITADHGKAERMIDPHSGERLTEHSTNDVPVFVVNKAYEREVADVERFRAKRESIGLLSDIAPTVLDLFGITIPKEMTGRSLLEDLGLQNVWRKTQE